VVTARFEQTIAAAKSGDDQAITTLYLTYNPLLVRYLAGSEPQVADDLAQEVWLSVAPRLPEFDGTEVHFRAWLFTIARRRLIDHWRTRTRRVTEFADQDRIAMTLAVDEVDRLESQSAVDALVGCLTAEQAEIVLLRVVAGLSVDEVARLVAKTPGAVRVIQHRALRRLAATISTTRVTP
jgi:RNA polymerase sigma-70 factor (ECF subfamily)